MKNITKLTAIYLLLFLSTTVVGALLLYLPVTGTQPLALIDAFFVASSAFTVTGLSTLDIPNQFNMLGESIILMLIQIGGLGIITLSIFILIISRRKISYKERSLLLLSWNSNNNGSLLKLTIQMITFSLVIELLGFIILTFVFVPTQGLAKGSFVSLFTSVSAFNNAGFALFSDNLMSYNHNLLINIIVPALIICGGIGYIVILDLCKTRRLKKLKLHTKIVVTSTLALIVVGTILFWLLESSHILKGTPWFQQGLTSFFQSVTTRTAGFNTIDIGQLQQPTLLLFIVLMFIGAAPMSAAGGIKVTTLALILIYIYAKIKGNTYPHIFKTSIAAKQISQAMLIFILAIIINFIAAFIITICEPKVEFLKIIFEVVSAFGTVGLSTGITADLTTLSKIVLICMMLLGKLGLFILLAIFQTPKAESAYYYAKEEVQL